MFLPVLKIGIMCSLTGNPLQQQAQLQALEQMSVDYLHQEITRVIMARQIYSLPNRSVKIFCSRD